MHALTTVLMHKTRLKRLGRPYKVLCSATSFLLDVRVFEKLYTSQLYTFLLHLSAVGDFLLGSNFLQQYYLKKPNRRLSCARYLCIFYLYHYTFPAFLELYKVGPLYKVDPFGWNSPGQIALQNTKLYTSALITSSQHQSTILRMSETGHLQAIE